MPYMTIIDQTPYDTLITDCDECLSYVTLDVTDADGILIGGECPNCEYYVTRYQRGMEPK